MDNNRSPLKINILWQKDFERGPELAELLYHNFTRNPKLPFARDMGIPISMETFGEKGIISSFKNNEYESYEHFVHLIFLDNRIFENDLWKKLDEALKSLENQDGHLILPVAFDAGVLQLENREITGRQVIRLFNVENDRQSYFLLVEVAHELIRLLDNRICHDEDGVPQSKTPQPIKVFLSHAKKDGENIALRLREHVNQYFGFETFFDANNIPAGAYFEDVLQDQVQQSIFLAIQTDEFSQSEWCTHELEWAKQHRRPIIILDLLVNGESRSYPYIGNLPTVRSTTDNLFEELGEIDLDKVELADLLLDQLVWQILQEGLRLRYHESLVEHLTTKIDGTLANQASDISEALQVEISPYPPELLTMAHLVEESETNFDSASNNRTLIYPNPPLGLREQKLIDLFNDRLDLQYRFITPNSLLLPPELELSQLTELKVAISISNIQDRVGSNLYVQDMLVEVAKALLHLGIGLAYGGDLFIGAKDGFNFTQTLFEIARTYIRLNTSTDFKKITNYSAFPFYHKIDNKVIAEHHRIAKFRKIEPDAKYQIKDQQAEEIFKQRNPHTFFARAKCLTKMRQIMTHETDARIVMGGQINGFLGKYPGILEEVLLTMQAHKPIYLLGGFGGAAGLAKDALLGMEPKILMEAFHRDEDYEEGKIAFNESIHVDEEEKIDYEKLFHYFKNEGEKDDFGLNNGLSKMENQKLFHSTNIYEIIQLILKGLSVVVNSRA